MPVYNSEKYLNEAIDSILNQTFSDFELIIINDGSTDGSENIILSYNDNRIKYFVNEKNIGILHTRLRMIAKAKGQYIAYLDNDDIAMTDRFEKEVEFLDNNPDYALCGAWGIMIGSDGKYLKKMNLSANDEDIKSNLLFSNCFIQSSMMFRRDILVQNPYDEAFPLAKDYNLWCILSEKYKLKNLSAHLVKYRWHATNESLKKKELMTSLTKKVMKRQLDNLGVNVTDEELNVHYAISDKLAQSMSDTQYLQILKLWLRKLVAANKTKAKYNNKAFISMVCFRWIFACKERNRIFLALRLPIFPSPAVLWHLFKLLYQRTK